MLFVHSSDLMAISANKDEVVIPLVEKSHGGQFGARKAMERM